MYEELMKRLRISAQWADKGLVITPSVCLDAANAIEAQDRHILTLQHEMLAEAESHTALVERLNKQIEELSKRVPKTPHGRLIDADALIAAICSRLCIKSVKYLSPEEATIVNEIYAAPTVIQAE